VTLKMPAFEWVHVQLHQQKGMISLSPPTICNSACRSTSDKQFWLPECQRKHIVTFTSGRLASSFHRNRLSVKKEE
ncbi:hypothetical protein, partial [Escherichia coli]|uniref:hypothetical protein n=1 Tax=Escherichia coli TaxID=562 RepID=UPI001A954FF6